MRRARPSILIYTQKDSDAILKEVLAGIEEEGVLFEVQKMEDEIEVKILANMASKNSILGVGMGISHDEVAVSFYKQVEYGMVDFGDICYRSKGQNAARYVKLHPFIFE